MGRDLDYVSNCCRVEGMANDWLGNKESGMGELERQYQRQGTYLHQTDLVLSPSTSKSDP